MRKVDPFPKSLCSVNRRPSFANRFVIANPSPVPPYRRAGFVYLGERFENLLGLLRRNPDACVGDFELIPLA